MFCGWFQLTGAIANVRDSLTLAPVGWNALCIDLTNFFEFFFLSRAAREKPSTPGGKRRLHVPRDSEKKFQKIRTVLIR